MSGDESPSRIYGGPISGRGRRCSRRPSAGGSRRPGPPGSSPDLVVEALFRGGWRNRDTWGRFELRDETAVAGIKFRALKGLRELVARDDESGDVVPSLAQSPRTVTSPSTWRRFPARASAALRVTGWPAPWPEPSRRGRRPSWTSTWTRSAASGVARTATIWRPLRRRPRAVPRVDPRVHGAAAALTPRSRPGRRRGRALTQGEPASRAGPGYPWTMALPTRIFPPGCSSPRGGGTRRRPPIARCVAGRTRSTASGTAVIAAACCAGGWR